MNDSKTTMDKKNKIVLKGQYNKFFKLSEESKIQTIYSEIYQKINSKVFMS